MEENMVAAVEANLYGLVSKTVCGGSGRISKWVLFKRRIMSDYNKTLQVWSPQILIKSRTSLSLHWLSP